MSEAPKLYQRLVKEFGMPECKTLMQLGNQWYLAPEGVSDDPNEAISTAVFRILPAEECAGIMAVHAEKWAAGLKAKETAPPATEPVARLRQIIERASRS
jgi:hypothetical protein